MKKTSKESRLEMRIDKQLKAKLKKLADADNRSMANYIIHLLEEAVKNQK
jgi:predicted HicB family RNase H-like nuclease